VKHDDQREAATTFISELQSGKIFIADDKNDQQITLKSSCNNINEELVNLTASLMQGEMSEMSV
jgi:hypothetical protein